MTQMSEDEIHIATGAMRDPKCLANQAAALVVAGGNHVEVQHPSNAGISPEVLWEFRNATLRELVLEIIRLRELIGA